MKRAIVIHRTDFIAIVSLVVIALAVVIYILEHQPSFTLDKSYYTVYAAVPDRGGGDGGPGTDGRHRGRRGRPGGRRQARERPRRRDDEHLQEVPADLQGRDGAAAAAYAAEGHVPGARPRDAARPGRCPTAACSAASATSPDVNVDQILASLDTDTRNYLLLLLSGGAGAFQNPGAKGAAPSPSAVRDLRGMFKRFAPLNRETQTFTKLLAQRQRNIRRSIHNLQRS